ncbi:MAG TPA: diacylglycerol kinase family protein, partial [Pyrinomonadaceae bacterium]
MSHTASIKVIINLASGSSDQEVRGRVNQAFEANGLDVDVSVAHGGEEIAALTGEAVAGNWKTIVAGGGDGTINLVASKIIDSGKVLGVLPLGTLNHFARDLKIPNDLEEAVRAIAAGRVIKVDAGEVNGRTFLNNSSLGLYPIIVREREKKQRLGSRKWPAFVWAAFSVLRRYPFLDVRLNVDGKEFHRRTPFVFIGNNEYAMEALNIGMREHLDRGHLSVYVAHRTGRWGLFRLAVRALFGRLKNEKDFQAMQTTELTIKTRHKRVRVAFDGEIDVMEGPLHYRVR